MYRNKGAIIVFIDIFVILFFIAIIKIINNDPPELKFSPYIDFRSEEFIVIRNDKKLGYVYADKIDDNFNNKYKSNEPVKKIIRPLIFECPIYCYNFYKVIEAEEKLFLIIQPPLSDKISHIYFLECYFNGARCDGSHIFIKEDLNVDFTE